MHIFFNLRDNFSGRELGLGFRDSKFSDRIVFLGIHLATNPWSDFHERFLCDIQYVDFLQEAAWLKKSVGDACMGQLSQ